jgi:antitoxin CptB
MNKALTQEETHLKRLKFRSWHRGWKETDLILGGFADTKLAVLEPALLAEYERLLDLDDDIIWSWIVGKSSPDAGFEAIIQLLRQHTGMV